MSGEALLRDVPALAAEMDEEALAELLELAAAADVEIVRGPRTGLVMMSCRDAFDCDFHLGEVLVSEAEVSCRGVAGYGMVAGGDPRRALARAAAEAIVNGADRLLKERLQRLAVRAAKELAERRAAEAALTARTRVRFDLMPGS
jgi:phosphonate C-P lyase system protein PhnG